MTNRKACSLERALSVSAKAFAERGYHGVSVAEIAIEAHCSTATIYEVFGSKQELYLAALSENRSACAPSPVPRPSETALQCLLRFALDRAAYLSSADVLSYAVPSGSIDPDRYDAKVGAAINAGNHLAEVATVVDHAIADGSMRDQDSRALAYLICAAVGFEPLAHRVMFGCGDHLDFKRAVRMIFAPLVTDAGAAELDAFMQMRKRSGSATRRLPSLLDCTRSSINDGTVA